LAGSGVGLFGSAANIRRFGIGDLPGDGLRFFLFHRKTPFFPFIFGQKEAFYAKKVPSAGGRGDEDQAVRGTNLLSTSSVVSSR
jgi:hypothetical protein